MRETFPSAAPTNPASVSNSPPTVVGEPWSILVVRMHAAGDVAITLPACSALKKLYPEARLDYLTTSSTAPLPQSLDLFDRIITFPDCTTRWERVYSIHRLRKTLQRMTYQTILDLQNNWVSRAIIRSFTPTILARFDRFSPIPAGERVFKAFQDGGFHNLRIRYSLPVCQDLTEIAAKKLQSHGWNPEKKLVVFNPAGLWESRNWPIEYYKQLARRFLQREDWQLLFLGTGRIRRRTDLISSGLPLAPIDLIGKTSLNEVLPMLSHVSLVVSEDSGLMHMAWTSGIPTIALLGSSRHDWSIPLGDHTRSLHSGDLPCGSCMEISCPYGDTFCLVRVPPYMVLDAIEAVLAPRGSFVR